MADEQRSESKIARHPSAPFPTPLCDRDWIEGIECPFDILRVFGRQNPRAPCFGARPRLASGALCPEYVFETRAQVWQRVRRLAWSLEHVLGLRRGQRVAFFSVTRAEVHVMSFAAAVAGLEVVPVYESLVGAASISHIVTHSGCVVVFASAAKLPVLSAALATLPAGAERPRMVSFDAAVPGVAEQTYQGLIDEGAAHVPDVEHSDADVAWARPQGAARPEDVAFVMYTSGTTGTPKGVAITHKNLVCATLAIVRSVPPSIRDERGLIAGEVIHLSFLPLAHIFGLMIDYSFLRLDGCLGFYSGSTADILTDLAALRPTAITSVPRLFQRVYDATMSALNKKPWHLRALFNAAWVWKNWWQWYGYSTPLVDKFVFGEIRNKLGGRMILAISGGAAIAKDVVDFWRITCVPAFWVGYGMTETTAMGIASELETSHDIFDNLMSPYFNVEAKLVSVPSMNYLATDNPPRGELCIRGPACTKGYLNDPIKTAEIIDKDGWVHTGDIAMLVGDRSFKIIDRVKDLFKLSQGEYVSGELIEVTICKSPAISQAFVHGEPDKNFPVAVVCPSHEWLLAFAKDNGIATRDIATLCKNPQAKAAVLEEALKQSRDAKLKGYEIIKAVHLHPGAFEVENDFLTPSLKLKRHVLRAYFANAIDNMYASV